MKHLDRDWNSMGEKAAVETPVGAVVPIIPDGTPTPPTLVLETVTLPGSSFTFTTATERFVESSTSFVGRAEAVRLIIAGLGLQEGLVAGIVKVGMAVGW